MRSIPFTNNKRDPARHAIHRSRPILHLQPRVHHLPFGAHDGAANISRSLVLALHSSIALLLLPFVCLFVGTMKVVLALIATAATASAFAPATNGARCTSKQNKSKWILF